MQRVNHQENLDPFENMLRYARNRDVFDRFEQDRSRQNLEADLQRID
ncbi:MAG: hypothetical protein PHO07_03370 [Pirellulales bacterium]|nr:hypothetical protein [Thermoguttaceae bacterium]MDD4786188.1 hypothetical protein [Pirellulales bacterium]MDI9444744.1 hypothetical protein [Planctomycetota bacterium]NLZ02281.1 hypothetical protein [Pirellulaceae bacterium]